MQKNKQTARLRSESGSIEIIIAIVVIVALLIGGGVYLWTKNNPKSSAEQKTTDQSQTTDKSDQESGLTISLLNGDLKVAAVDGWSKGYETTMVRDIDGTSFKISAQPQGVDMLKADTVGGYASELKTVTTTQKTTLHIIKIGKSQDATNLAVSTCAPSGGFGCSPSLDNDKLYFTLSPATSGATLDYSLPATTTAIAEFETIAKSLPL